MRAYLYTAIVAAVLAAGAWWHLSRVKAAEQAVHAHYLTVLAGISEKTAAAERAIRVTEQAWQKSIEGIAKNGQVQIDTAKRDAADAARAADGLRAALNRYRAATGPAANPGIAGAGPGLAGRDPLDLFIGMLTRHTAELVAVGEYADQVRAAGVTCERSYDALVGGS